MSDQTVGTCSECGGRVTVPTVWYGIDPPTPTCSSCGAMPADPAYGPVISMKKLSLAGPKPWSNLFPSFRPTSGSKPGGTHEI